MDPITVTLRSSKSPAASAPVGGELSATEVDANFTALKTASEQLNAEKLGVDDAVALAWPADSKPAPIADADYIPIWDTEASPPRWKLASKAAILSGISGSSLSSLGLWDYWYAVRLATTGAAAPDMFAGAAVSSGTNNTAIPAGGQAGFNSYGVFLRSGTTANGGYRYQTTSLVADYFGTISHKFRGQFLWRTSFTGRTVRMGYLDTVTSADATDGAYFEIADAVCSAKTASNSTRTTDATTITLALDTAYTFDIDVNAAGDAAQFRVYGGTSTAALMDVTITTNIPTTSARAFGAGIVATESSTTASDIGILYSLGVGTVEGFARSVGAVEPPAATVPAAFTAGQWTSTPGDAEIVVDITALPSDGGSSITALQYTLNGSTWTAFAGTGTGSRTITGLTNATAYPVQIRAVNAIGNGAASDTKSTTPTAASPASGLAIVQDAGRVAEAYTRTPQQIITAPASGNSLVVSVQASASSGVPTISDSAGGTWGAALYSYDATETGNAFFVFARNNVTDAPTWVQANFGADGFTTVGAIEVSGAGTGLVLDGSGGVSPQSSTASWEYPFTSTADDVLLLAFAALNSGRTASGTAPLVSTTDADAYSFYARGIFPTAGANTGIVTLSASESGDKAWAVLRAGA